jgi:hypothetical protein
MPYLTITTKEARVGPKCSWLMDLLIWIGGIRRAPHPSRWLGALRYAVPAALKPRVAILGHPRDAMRRAPKGRLLSALRLVPRVALRTTVPGPPVSKLGRAAKFVTYASLRRSLSGGRTTSRPSTGNAFSSIENPGPSLCGRRRRFWPNSYPYCRYSRIPRR